MNQLHFFLFLLFFFNLTCLFMYSSAVCSLKPVHLSFTIFDLHVYYETIKAQQ